MGITNSNKLISTNTIDCEGTLTVNLTLAAAPDIVSNPTDIVLALDRSGSMRGIPLESLKLGVNTFIDIIAESTGGAQDGQIGSGSSMAIVSFSSVATQDTQLITSVDDLKATADSLTAGGNTNHGDAFEKAFALFDPASPNEKVIVMFTDGKTTAGPPPTPIAEAIKAAGVTIFIIGLIGDDGIDEEALNSWATAPPATHVAIAPTAADLERIFEDLAKNISKTGATGIRIEDIIHDDFVIINVEQPTKGTVTLMNQTTLVWNIEELGVTGDEGASLMFTVQHINNHEGTVPVNESITYTDNEGQQPTFQNPLVTVRCDTVVRPEPCPEPIPVSIDGCSDSVIYSVGDAVLESLGRILQLDINIKNVCPGRRTALAVIVHELDEYGEAHPRGMKTITVPAHHNGSCSDVLVKCIKFVLPEDLDVSGGPVNGICNERNFTVEIICNYIDTDFQCCNLL